MKETEGDPCFIDYSWVVGYSEVDRPAVAIQTIARALRRLGQAFRQCRRPPLHGYVNPHFKKYFLTLYFRTASRHCHFAGYFPFSARNGLNVRKWALPQSTR
jgi:hypothetical protein